MAAFWLSGCAHTAPPPVNPTTGSAAAGAPGAISPDAMLPDPQSLIDVLAKMTDPAVPGAQKIGLVEGATVEDAAVFDRFAKALSDNQMLPMTFSASDLAWSDTTHGNITANMTLIPPDGHGQPFNFPMEFHPGTGGWQLSRDSADLLLTFGAQ